MSVPAIQPNLWRNFYNGAFCETGDKTARLVKVNPSTSICLWRLTAFSREGPSECENILTALDDLKILKSLQTRDSPEVAEVQRRYFVARCNAVAPINKSCGWRIIISPMIPQELGALTAWGTTGEQVEERAW